MLTGLMSIKSNLKLVSLDEELTAAEYLKSPADEAFYADSAGRSRLLPGHARQKETAMLQQVNKRHTKHANNPAGVGKTAASHLTIPKLKFPRKEVRSQGNHEDIAILVSELSRRLRLDDILAEHHIPGEVLELSFRKWFSRFIIPEIDALIDTNVTFFPIERTWYNNDDYGDVFPENGWIFLFSLNTVNYETFDISSQVCDYEKRIPGLGQYLLQAIDLTPYELATPAYMKSIISYTFWNGLDDEKEYAEDFAGEDKDEYMDILGSVGIRLDDLETNIPAWALKPQRRHMETISDEIAEIKALASVVGEFEHMIFPYGNLPAIMLWEEKHDMWYKTLLSAETDAMEAGTDMQFNGRYWPMPLDNPRQLHEVFNEIEAYIGGFYKVLQAIYNIKKR